MSESVKEEKELDHRPLCLSYIVSGHILLIRGCLNWPTRDGSGVGWNESQVLISHYWSVTGLCCLRRWQWQKKKGPYGDSGDRFAADKFSGRLRSPTEVYYTVNIDSEQVWRSGNGLSWWADWSRFESASGHLFFTNCGLRTLSCDFLHPNS